MYELDALNEHESAEAARDLILHVFEICTQEQMRMLCHILGEGGAAYNLQVVQKVLATRGRLDETKRLGALFTEYTRGFGDPVVRAAFLLGVKKLMASNGQLDAEEAAEILNDFGVAETQDIRDELERMKVTKGTASSWSVLDILGLAATGATIAGLARKVPWARLATLLLLRK